MGDGKYTKFKICVDVASVIFVAYVIGLYVWAHITPDAPTESGHLPIPIIIALIDLIPCVLGAAWLLYRYGDTVEQRFPIVKSKWFLALLLLAALLGPTLTRIVNSLLEGKSWYQV